LDKAAICISPMIGGSGTSLKILEYMASAKAVVSTTVGVRGIDCTNGKDVLLADDAASFADSILGLMASTQRCAELAHNARALVLAVYDWNAVGDHLAAGLAA